MVRLLREMDSDSYLWRMLLKVEDVGREVSKMLPKKRRCFNSNIPHPSLVGEIS
jgi:hypothetical protein